MIYIILKKRHFNTLIIWVITLIEYKKVVKGSYHFYQLRIQLIPNLLQG